MKTEIVEQAATKLIHKKYPHHPLRDSKYWKDMFIEGAKWQEEQDYLFIDENIKYKKIIDKLTNSYEDALNIQKASNAGYESKIKELEQKLTDQKKYSEKDMKAAFLSGFHRAYGCIPQWLERTKEFFNEWIEQHKKEK